MKRFALFAVAGLIAFGSSFAAPQPNLEANKIAREAGEAAKNQDWDTAIDGFRKAAGMDKKYEPNLAAALQQRANESTKQNRFQDAINDLNDAIKIRPSAGAFEARAYVYMRMNDKDHALADYSDAIKANPGEARLYSYRAHILADKNDLKGAMADTDKVLKLKKGDPDAAAMKKWIEDRMKAPPPIPPGPVAAPGTAPANPQPSPR